MDDIIITRNSPSGIYDLVIQLNATFSLKDLGWLDYFLGIEVYYSQIGIHLNQQKYAKDLITKCNLQNNKHVKIPIISRKLLNKHDGMALEDPSKYINVVGGLQYHTLTRPKIPFDVNRLC